MHRISSRHEFAPLLLTSEFVDQDKLLSVDKRRMHKNRYGNKSGSQTPSDNGGGSYYDSDSMRSKGSDSQGGRRRPRVTESHFQLKRLMDDLRCNDTIKGAFPSSGSGQDLVALECQQAEEDAEIYDAIDTIDEAIGNDAGGSHANNVSPGETPRHVIEKGESLCLATRPFQISVKRPTNLPRDLEPTGPPDRTYKVVFAGDAAVGKTSFINRLTKNRFISNLSSTLGVDFQVKTIRVDERNVAIQLWDTAGQERFRSVTRSYFRRADGVMLLYDITSDRSFLSVRQWIDAIDVSSITYIAPLYRCIHQKFILCS